MSYGCCLSRALCCSWGAEGRDTTSQAQELGPHTHPHGVPFPPREGWLFPSQPIYWTEQQRKGGRPHPGKGLHELCESHGGLDQGRVSTTHGRPVRRRPCVPRVWVEGQMLLLPQAEVQEPLLERLAPESSACATKGLGGRLFSWLPRLCGHRPPGRGTVPKLPVRCPTVLMFEKWPFPLLHEGTP